MAEYIENANEPEIISDQSRIVSMMGRLYHGRAALTITLPDSKIRSKSMILDLNPETGRFLLNKFQPEHAHKKFLDSKVFYAHSQLDGIETRFSSNLVNAFSEGDDVYYLITIPGKIDYHQRRSFQRICLSNLVIIPVTITLEDDTSFEGQMDDISAGGISILFYSDLPATVQNGTLIKECKFRIPEGSMVTCRLQARFINHRHDTSLPKIGAQFVNLDMGQNNILQQFVASMARQYAKESVEEA